MKVVTTVRRHDSSPSTSHCMDVCDQLCDVDGRADESGEPRRSGSGQDAAAGGGGGGGAARVSGSASSARIRTSWSNCCRRFYAITQPLLQVFGQCMFGVAMLLIMAGIALCIWGYVGEAIRPFQIFGPVSIGVGFLIYFMGCLLCCRKYNAFEKNVRQKAKQEKVRQAVEMLNDKDMIHWIQNDPEMYEDFREAAAQILSQQLHATESSNIIVNVYASNSTLDQT